MNYFLTKKVMSKFFVLSMSLFMLLATNTTLASVNSLTDSAPALVEQMARKVTIDVTNTTIREVAYLIQQQAKVNIIIEDANIDKLPKIDYKVVELSVSDALDKLLTNTTYDYRLNNNSVAIVKRIVAEQNPQNEELEVVGKVLDENGKPIVGATVLVEGTVIGSITDNNGAFAFKAPKGAKINISCVGYIEQTISLTTANLTVKLIEDTVAVEDVVVTGYQNISKGRATGSYDTVSKTATDKVVSSNIADKLVGNVAGLTVDANGDMLLRGAASLYANTKPLIVVDGFPMEYDLENINPNDIANITVLKDAAAASIWGVRAANGVIVITTKRANRNEKLSVTYNSNIKISSGTDFESLGYMSAYDQVYFEKYAYENGYYSGPYGGGLKNTSYFFSPIAEIYFNDDLTESQKDSKYAELASYDNSDYVKDNFYRTPVFQQHNISLSAGGENSTTYMSLNYEKNIAELVGNNSDKFSFQMNNTLAISKWAKASFGVRGNYGSNSNYSGGGVISDPYTSLPAYYRFEDENGDFVNQYYGLSQYKKEESSTLGFTDWGYNALEDRELVDDKLKSYNFALNAKFDFDLPFNIKLSTSGMYIVDNGEQNVLYGEDSYFVRTMYNEFTSYDDVNMVQTNHLPAGAIKDVTMSRSTSYTWRNVISYQADFDKFSINAQGGTEIFALRQFVNYDRYYGYDAQGMSYDYTMNFEDLINVGVPGYAYTYPVKLSYSPYQTDVEDRYFSTFATADISFDSRYTLFGSIRYDKTNLFGQSAEYRDQPTWSIGGRWSVVQEKFFKSNVISNLGLKASYGLSGNVDKTTSPYLIASMKNDTYGNYLNYYDVANPANPLLGWEKVYTFNFGVDVSMFSNRLNVSIDGYNRYTKDALGDNIVDATVGFESIKMNSASILNRGFDLSINGDIVRNKVIAWNSNINLSYNYNEVTDINSGDPSISTITSNQPLIGQPIDYVWAYNFAGLDENGDTQIYTDSGDVISHTSYNNLTIDDLLFLGSYSPKVFGGWSNNITWNGFNLDFLVTYQFGSKLRMPSNENGYPTIDGRISNYYAGTWKEDNTSAQAPRYDFVDANSRSGDIYKYSQEYVESGDYIRLKSIGLAYNFKKILSLDMVKELSLKFSAENIVKWVSNSKGLDPEMVSRSSAFRQQISYYGDLPKYYNFTLNVTF